MMMMMMMIMIIIIMMIVATDDDDNVIDNVDDVVDDDDVYDDSHRTSYIVKLRIPLIVAEQSVFANTVMLNNWNHIHIIDIARIIVDRDWYLLSSCQKLMKLLS